MATDRKTYMREYRAQNREKWRRTPEQQARVNARRREKYAQDAEYRAQARAKVKEWQRANPSKRKAQRVRRYGLTLDQFSALLATQSGACAICGYSDMSDPNYFPVVDHCHSTGRVRGLLCSNCNHALGKFNDEPARLRRAAEYLEAMNEQA